MSSTFVIAEGGSCHDGIYEKAVGLIDVAKDAGADAFKAQYWSSAQRLAERRNAAAYLPIYTQYQMPKAWLHGLAHECKVRGLEFMCTTYLPEDISIVAPYVSRFKIASFEASDLDFVRKHANYGKPVLISTGMMERRPTHTHGDMEVFWLHCVSSYPAPVEQANLGVLRRGEFDGFSDHTHHIMTGAFAVCAGASILEVHIKDWMTSKTNPDAGTALSPYEITQYVANVRLAERMLGDGVKREMPCEAAMAAYKVRA